MKMILSLLCILCISTGFTSSELANLNPLSGRGFVNEDNNKKPGDLINIQLEINLQEGFFAYHDKFDLKVSSPKGFKSGELFIDPIVSFKDQISKKTKKGVQGKATIKTQLQIPQIDQSVASIKAELTYIACTEKVCLTPRVLNIDIPILITADKVAIDKTSSQYIQKQIDENFYYALLLIFVFGFLTSLTPCVYPLIPITLAVLGTKEDRSKLTSFTISLSYVIGIGLTYAILGVIAAKTGQLFGSFISHPAVIIATSLIFVVMGFSLLGFFELQLPGPLRNKLSTVSTGKGHGGAFLSGLLAGIVASPCVGPVLVGVLAYIAQSQDGFLGFILLFTFAMGLSLLLLIIGTFGQLANKIPRSGAWMNTVKTILAFCLFALAIWYAWPVLKPFVSQGTKVSKSQGVQWQKFSPELVTKAKAEGKPVIIDFYADWCLSCVEMDQLTFINKDVINKSKDFVMLKVDATKPFDELSEWQSQYKVYGLPTMVFIGKDGVVNKDITLTGFEKAEEFLIRMETTLNPITPTSQPQ